MIGKGIPVSPEAQRLHDESLVLDCHSHFLINAYLFKRRFHEAASRPAVYNPFKNTLDLDSVTRGGINALAFTSYIPGRPLNWHPFRSTERIIDRYYEVVEESGGKLAHCTGPAAIRQARAEGRLAAFLAMEGGHPVGDDLDNVAHFHQRGVRMMTLTHFISNGIADATSSPYRPLDGLSEFGRKVVGEMERLGMMVDVAHCTDKAMRDVLRVATKPVIYSHGGLRRFNRHLERNLSDDLAREIAAQGGLIGIIFFLRYLGKAGFDIRAAARHAAAAAELCGPEHLCVGTDLDGYTYTPWGFRDASDWPQFTQALLDEGFSADDVRGILGENFLRYWEAI